MGTSRKASGSSGYRQVRFVLVCSRPWRLVSSSLSVAHAQHSKRLWFLDVALLFRRRHPPSLGRCLLQLFSVEADQRSKLVSLSPNTFIFTIATKCQTKPQVTHSERLKMDIKENKTVKSHFTCSLSSLLGFWVVLESFRFFSSDFLKKNPERLQNHPETEKRGQRTFQYAHICCVLQTSGYHRISRA